MADVPSAGARIAAALLGLGLGWQLTTHLDMIPSTVITSLLLAGAATGIGSHTLSPRQHWLLLGIATGALTGTATVLAERVQSVDPQGNVQQRLLAVGVVGLAGAIAGSRLSWDSTREDRRHPRDMLRSASALTTGMFALLVTFTFVHSGLDVARTFSSRLSTTLTILVATLTVPGWLTHLLQPRRSHHGSR